MSILAFLFENSPFDPFWSALLVGFAAFDWNGELCRTPAGEEYLAGLE
jgi:hypothetical protein